MQTAKIPCEFSTELIAAITFSLTTIGSEEINLLN